MSLVATDGHRLAIVTPRDAKATKGEPDELKAILRKKTMGELARLLSEGEGDIIYERGENHLFFEVGGRLLISRMIDGQFPRERVIPKGNDKHIEFERDRLTNAVKRVALLSNERSRREVPGRKGKGRRHPSSPELGEAQEHSCRLQRTVDANLFQRAIRAGFPGRRHDRRRVAGPQG
jgi:DNA polymerase-3 subunit beta